MMNTTTNRSMYSLLGKPDSIFSSIVASLAMDPPSRTHLTPPKYFNTLYGPGKGHKLNMNTVMIYEELQSTSTSRYSVHTMTYQHQESLLIFPLEILAVDRGGLNHIKDGLSNT